MKYESEIIQKCFDSPPSSVKSLLSVLAKFPKWRYLYADPDPTLRGREHRNYIFRLLSNLQSALHFSLPHLFGKTPLDLLLFSFNKLSPSNFLELRLTVGNVTR